MKYTLVIVTLVTMALTVRGELFAFSAITSNDSSGNAQDVGEAQLYMDVTLLVAGQASLVFTNTGPNDAVASCIYFDSTPELNLSLLSINNTEGVEFQAKSIHPRNLPSGQETANEFVSDFGVAARNPSTKNGINPYERLELIMSYDDSRDLLDVLWSEGLRVGLHVQGFTGGYSESFVNQPVPGNIPEPGTLPLLLAGCFALRWLRIRTIAA